MRTTIDLPDELFRQVKARAALDGLKLKELITRYIEQGLREGTRDPAVSVQRRRSVPPVVRLAGDQVLPRRTHAELCAILEDEEVAHGRGE